MHISDPGPCCVNRFVRLGTASLLSDSCGPFINLDKLDLQKYATRPCLARVLCDYMLYHEHNPKRALELCAQANASDKFEVHCQLFSGSMHICLVTVTSALDTAVCCSDDC